MTPHELRNSVLQYAIQGKLVPQYTEDGTAIGLKSELLAKKSEWVAAGKMLKKADTKPFLQSDDLFDIPTTWEWVQLSDVSIIQEGAGIRKWQYADCGTQILCVTNILDGSIDLSKKQLYISTEEYLEKYQHLTLNKGDIVTSCSGGSWGKISFFDCDETMMLNTSTLRMRFIGDLADNNYLYYVCKGPFFKRQLELQLSGMQPNFGYAHYSRILFPLPPLAEQKRIVAKLEEILPLIDRYETAWNKLEEFNKRFPGDMQKSILQMAIQGKLVEQRSKEGTGEELFQQVQTEKQALIKAGKIKKEKPLPEIAEEEIPFDLPESWKWVRLGHLVEIITSGSRDWAKYYSPTGDIFLRMGNLSRNSFELRLDKIQRVKLPEKAEGQRTSLQAGDLLFSITGEVGTLGLIPDNFGVAYINQHTAMIRFLLCLRNRYIPYLLLTDYAQKFYNGNQHGIKNSFRLDTIAMLPVPLPPLEEQKRIVAKLEEILPLCERLK